MVPPPPPPQLDKINKGMDDLNTEGADILKLHHCQSSVMQITGFDGREKKWQY